MVATRVPFIWSPTNGAQSSMLIRLVSVALEKQCLGLGDCNARLYLLHRALVQFFVTILGLTEVAEHVKT